MNKRVLFVDDDTRILSAFRRRLRKNYDFHVAEGAEEALHELACENPFAVVISDQQMPGMKGIEFLKIVMERYPSTVRIMLTGNADRETAVASVNESGVFRYLNKPCSLEAIVNAVDDGLAEHKLLAGRQNLLEGTLAGSIKLISQMIANCDPDASKKAKKLHRHAHNIALYMKSEKVWELDVAACLSPLATIMLPPTIRLKIAAGSSLSPQEKLTVAKGPETAQKLILNMPRMKDVAETLLYIEKGFDGSGAPHADICGHNIPLNARLLYLLRALLEIAGDGPITSDTFADLPSDSNCFDPDLVQAARACCLNPGANAALKLKEMQIDIVALKTGDKAVEDFKTRSGNKVLSAGAELTAATLEKIRTFHETRPIAQPVRITRKVSETVSDVSRVAQPEDSQVVLL